MDPNKIHVSEAARQAARTYLEVTVTLLTIALATLTARIAFKLRSSVRLVIDDYLILIGSVKLIFKPSLSRLADKPFLPASCRN